MRASVYDIVKADEGQHIIDHGIFKEVDDLYEMQQDAAIILPHICNFRCKNRVVSNGNANNFQYKKIQNLKISPDNIKYCYIKLSIEHTPECIENLIQIRIIDPIYIVKDILTAYIESGHSFSLKSTCLLLTQHTITILVLLKDIHLCN